MPIDDVSYQSRSEESLRYERMSFHERKAHRIKFGVPKKYKGQ